MVHFNIFHLVDYFKLVTSTIQAPPSNTIPLLLGLMESLQICMRSKAYANM